VVGPAAWHRGHGLPRRVPMGVRRGTCDPTDPAGAAASPSNRRVDDMASELIRGAAEARPCWWAGVR
jgi:hypothetical protein